MFHTPGVETNNAGFQAKVSVHFTLFFAALLLSSASNPACADLRIRGATLHSPLWRRVFAQLPAVWKASRVVVVRELSDDAMDHLVARFEGLNDRDDSIVDGCFQEADAGRNMPARITLRDSLRGDDAATVFVHEYGHYVWSEILTGPQRARYRRIWREQSISDSLVTSYAGESEEEGFAEAFAFFIRKPVVLRRRDGLSWQFLKAVQADREDSLSLPYYSTR